MCSLTARKLVLDRWFPSSKSCSHCGFIKKSLSLSERVFNWELCGLSCDRDFNANLNQAIAVSSTVNACGLNNADVAWLKQEQK